MEIRNEIESDFANIRDLHLSTFPSAAKGDLVDALRKYGDAVLSLVAVLADRRRQEIAVKLIRRGLDLAKVEGW